jgi:hypothetical protein
LSWGFISNQKRGETVMPFSESRGAAPAVGSHEWIEHYAQQCWSEKGDVNWLQVGDYNLAIREDRDDPNRWLIRIKNDDDRQERLTISNGGLDKAKRYSLRELARLSKNNWFGA